MPYKVPGFCFCQTVRTAFATLDTPQAHDYHSFVFRTVHPDKEV